MEIARYATLHLTIDAEQTIPYSFDAGRLLRDLGMADQPQEVLWVITYDSIQQVRTVVEIARGGYHEIDIPISAILSAVLLAGTDRFMIAHNHPTDDIVPTALDVDLTSKVLAAANTVGLHFEDHVIVGPGPETFSFFEAGIMERSASLRRMARTHTKVKT